MTPQEKKIVIWTMLGEAAGESDQGLAAVAHVIANRAATPGRWRNTMAGVAKQGNSKGIHQFSTWNAAHMEGNNPSSRYPVNGKQFKRAERILDKVLDGTIPDPTGGADHYFADYIKPPSWSKGMKSTGKIGRHKFYREASRPADTSKILAPPKPVAPDRVPERPSWRTNEAPKPPVRRPSWQDTAKKNIEESVKKNTSWKQKWDIGIGSQAGKATARKVSEITGGVAGAVGNAANSVFDFVTEYIPIKQPAVTAAPAQGEQLAQLDPVAMRRYNRAEALFNENPPIGNMPAIPPAGANPLAPLEEATAGQTAAAAANPGVVYKKVQRRVPRAKPKDPVRDEFTRKFGSGAVAHSSGYVYKQYTTATGKKKWKQVGKTNKAESERFGTRYTAKNDEAVKRYNAKKANEKTGNRTYNTRTNKWEWD